MDKYKNKYRIASARASWWDYSANGRYFITVCTHKRKWLFGTIVNKELVTSSIGQIVLEEWHKSFDIRKELFCEAFVLMPNHLHAILRIDRDAADLDAGASDVGVVETHGRASLQPQPTGVAYRPPKSISSFMAGFKSAATTRINQGQNTPGMPVWQPRFHDHIIRNEPEYERIARYIENNPSKWEDDCFFK